MIDVTLILFGASLILFFGFFAGWVFKKISVPDVLFLIILGFVIGPQLNAASRLDDSSLPTKLLISEDIGTIESISRKLILLNEKR